MCCGTILIADDDSVMRRLLEHYLQHAGYVVLSAINGAEALERVRAERVDVVITDLHMPIADGIDVCEFMRDTSPTSRVPVIMISSPGERLTRQEVAGLGVFAWLIKPLSPPDLLATVSRALNR